MIDEHHQHDEGDEGNDEGLEETLDLELDTQSQIFLEMRQQNVELLKIAAQVAGLTGNHGALKPNELSQAMRSLWNIYAEFYSWIDPEESEDDEDEDDEE
jgi:hypothetical protein